MSGITRIGIDAGAERVLVARVSTGENGPDASSVESLTPDQAIESSPDATVTIAVPDREVTVKSLYLPPSNAIELLPRASFELSQAVLEPPEQFQFDAFPTSIRDRTIGLIYRRELLCELKHRLLNSNEAMNSHRFLMRAVAVGRGYLQFAELDSEGLLCLADLANQAVSLCFLYDKAIVAVGHMGVGGTETASERSMRAFGINLKSLVNFHLSGCAQSGLSVPLSTVVMCGGMAAPVMLDAITPLFSARVAVPKLGNANVTFDSTNDSITFPDCVAALGLTVN